MTRRLGRRGLLAVGILVLWIAGLGLLAQRELFRPHAERLIEAGLRVTPGATAFAVLRDGEQIGFASTTVDTVAGGITVVDYFVTDLPVAGKLHRTSRRTTVRLTRALRVSSFTVDVSGDSTPVTMSGHTVGDSLLLLTRNIVGRQPIDTQHIRLNGPVLLPTLIPLAVALGERPAAGRSTTLPVFDPATMSPANVRISVQAESLFVLEDSSVFDPTSKRWRGALPDTVRAWRLSTDSSVMAGFTGWVDEQGRVVRLERRGGLTLERRPYEVAFENWKDDEADRGATPAAGSDISVATAIAAGKAPTSTLSELTMRVSGIDFGDLDLKGYRQHVSGDTVTITREAPSALQATYALPDGARATVMAVFLDPEPTIESASGEIIAQAMRLRGSERNPRIVAERINAWVHDSIQRAVAVGKPGAFATLRARAGDGAEHAKLFVALARAIGVPARAATGLLYVDGKFYNDTWGEVWLERWVAVDPTFGQFPADASHLRFIIEAPNKQADIRRSIGTLRIDVLSSR